VEEATWVESAPVVPVWDFEKVSEVDFEPQPKKDKERNCCVRYVLPGLILRVDLEKDRGVERVLSEY